MDVTTPDQALLMSVTVAAGALTLSSSIPSVLASSKADSKAVNVLPSKSGLMVPVRSDGKFHVDLASARSTVVGSIPQKLEHELSIQG